MAYTKAFLAINDDFDEDRQPVYHCTFEFNRKIDIRTGHTQGPMIGGIVQVAVEVDKTTRILELMINNELFKGMLTFEADTGTGGSTKTIKFTNAKCVDYRETFDHDNVGGFGMTLNFSFWCETMDVASANYSVEWKKEKDGD